MHQGGRVERLAWFFPSELLGREPAQLIVNQRQELGGGLGIALLDGRQDARDFVHRRPPEWESPGGPFGGTDYVPVPAAEQAARRLVRVFPILRTFAFS